MKIYGIIIAVVLVLTCQTVQAGTVEVRIPENKGYAHVKLTIRKVPTVVTSSSSTMGKNCDDNYEKEKIFEGSKVSFPPVTCSVKYSSGAAPVALGLGVLAPGVVAANDAAHVAASGMEGAYMTAVIMASGGYNCKKIGPLVTDCTSFKGQVERIYTDYYNADKFRLEDVKCTIKSKKLNCSARRK